MEHKFSRCESCAFILDPGKDGLPECLLTNKNTGLLLCCDKYKEKTGEHISY